MKVAAATIPHYQPNEDHDLVDDKLTLFGVFDGVGGTAGGGRAAKIAADVICEFVREQIYKAKKPIGKKLLENAVLLAAKNVELDGQIYGRLNQCTTATVVKISNNQATIANVGDSRCYGLTKKGQLKRLTKDHGILEELVRTGQISAKIAKKVDQAKARKNLSLTEIEIFSQRNIITKAVGPDFSESDINFTEFALNNFKMLILTTDGIHDNLTDLEIEEIVKQGKPPKEIAKNLVNAAFDISTQNLLRSKPDDITAVVINL